MVSTAPNGASCVRDRCYGAGLSKDWIKVKNRTHPAMERSMDNR